jgi:hypothetical protein
MKVSERIAKALGFADTNNVTAEIRTLDEFGRPGHEHISKVNHAFKSSMIPEIPNTFISDKTRIFPDRKNNYVCLYNPINDSRFNYIKAIVSKKTNKLIIITSYPRTSIQEDPNSELL